MQLISLWQMGSKKSSNAGRTVMHSWPFYMLPSFFADIFGCVAHKRLREDEVNAVDRGLLEAQDARLQFHWSVLAKRNPRPLLRFSGPTLLRPADRSCPATLTQEPLR